MVRGCLEWQAIGLNEPEKVRQATADYRDEMDPIAEFIAALCVKGPEHWSARHSLYEAYNGWCGQNRR